MTPPPWPVAPACRIAHRALAALPSSCCRAFVLPARTRGRSLAGSAGADARTAHERLAGPTGPTTSRPGPASQPGTWRGDSRHTIWRLEKGSRGAPCLLARWTVAWQRTSGCACFLMKHVPGMEGRCGTVSPRRTSRGRRPRPSLSSGSTRRTSRGRTAATQDRPAGLRSGTEPSGSVGRRRRWQPCGISGVVAGLPAGLAASGACRLDAGGDPRGLPVRVCRESGRAGSGQNGRERRRKRLSPLREQLYAAGIPDGKATLRSNLLLRRMAVATDRGGFGEDQGFTGSRKMARIGRRNCGAPAILKLT